MKKVRLLWVVLKRSGVHKVLIAFVALFMAASLVVWLFEPSLNTYGDALWFMWAVSLTVGLGDFTAITTVGRVVTVICSLCAVLVTAVVTGVVVDYINELRQHQLNQSVTEFLDKLERLPELSEDELVDLSERVKRFRKD